MYPIKRYIDQHHDDVLSDLNIEGKLCSETVKNRFYLFITSVFYSRKLSYGPELGVAPFYLHRILEKIKNSEKKIKEYTEDEIDQLLENLYLSLWVNAKIRYKFHRDEKEPVSDCFLEMAFFIDGCAFEFFNALLEKEIFLNLSVFRGLTHALKTLKEAGRSNLFFAMLLLFREDFGFSGHSRECLEYLSQVSYFLLNLSEDKMNGVLSLNKDHIVEHLRDQFYLIHFRSRLFSLDVFNGNDNDPDFLLIREKINGLEKIAVLSTLLEELQKLSQAKRLNSEIIRAFLSEPIVYGNLPDSECEINIIDFSEYLLNLTERFFLESTVEIFLNDFIENDILRKICCSEHMSKIISGENGSLIIGKISGILEEAMLVALEDCFCSLSERGRFSEPVCLAFLENLSDSTPERLFSLFDIICNLNYEKYQEIIRRPDSVSELSSLLLPLERPSMVSLKRRRIVEDNEVFDGDYSKIPCLTPI